MTSANLSFEIHGHVLPEFEAVRDAFVENFKTRNEIGAAVAVVIDGEMVVDLWGGIRDRDTGADWEEDTMVLVFSTTKGVAGLVMALAHTRGWIDYEGRIAEYWPEFAQNGKESITVRQLLSHQAGLHAFHQKVDREIIADLDRLARIMEAERPQWPPGQHYAYHIISLGFYEGELIRRVDPEHRTLAQVFREEIALPLDVDFHIRVPADINDDQLAKLKMPGFVKSILGLPTGMLFPVLNPWSHVFRSTMVNPGTTIVLDKDRTVARDLEVPAGGGIGTARALATMYGEFAAGGKRLGLRPETLAALSAEPIWPTAGCWDMCLKEDAAYSLGFMKPNAAFSFGEPTAFGMPGAGGSMGYARPDVKLGFGYVMNSMGTGINADPREVALRQALAESLK